MLQQLLNFHSGRPVYCFPLLFCLQSCPWEGWVSDGEEVGTDGSDRGMFILDVHVVPPYPTENSPSPLHSEGCTKHFCVFRGSCADIASGSLRAIGRLRCGHSLLKPSLTQTSYFPLMGSSRLGCDLGIVCRHPVPFVCSSVPQWYWWCYGRALTLCLKKFLHSIYLLSLWLLVVPNGM